MILCRVETVPAAGPVGATGAFSDAPSPDAQAGLGSGAAAEGRVVGAPARGTEHAPPFSAPSLHTEAR